MRSQITVTSLHPTYTSGNGGQHTNTNTTSTTPRQQSHPVVKVRGNAGKRRSWAPENCWRAFPGPTQPLMVWAGWKGPLQLTVGPQLFFRVPGPPNLYFNRWSHHQAGGRRSRNLSKYAAFPGMLRAFRTQRRLNSYCKRLNNGSSMINDSVSP